MPAAPVYCTCVLQVTDMCVGKAACSVPNFVVPDPCVGTYKWASVGYTCQPEGEQQAV